LPFKLIAYISAMTASKKRKKSGGVFLVLLTLIIGALYVTYMIFGPNTGSFGKEKYLYIRTGSDFGQVIAALQENGIVNNIQSFTAVARAMKYPDKVRAGKYRIKGGMSNFKLVRMLRAGNQFPVKVVIHRLRTKADLVRVLSTYLEADSARFMHLVTDQEYLATLGTDTNALLAIVMPDTYEFYWNTPPEKALEKLKKTATRFWTTERTEKARIHGINPLQAIIIASIVDEETNANSDKPLIASVYLNRLRIGMPLQADPTVKYAIGDFGIRRVTGAMLQFNSPYNTYKYPGLPPGPICTPAISTIDAVLNAPSTTYIYFCAKADFSGYSVFASTFDQQIRNANAYRKALNTRGIH
jgi:UPF0755 protein